MKQLSRKIVALLVCLLPALMVSAQAIKDIKINEVLVKNVDSYEDDYGHRVGWIELYNSGFSQVDIAGSFLTVKRGDKTLTYRIPKNDKRTIIPPQGYVIFFAEGTSSKGTFHTNFTLDQTGYLALLDQSGRGPAIDSVLYDVNGMKEDISIGYYEAEDGTMQFGELNATTPLSTNDTVEKEPRHEHFKRIDPFGVGMAIVAMSVVFCALVVLYQIFKQVGRTAIRLERKKQEKKVAAAAGTAPVSQGTSKKPSQDIAGEELAAIAMALYKFSEDLHDNESTVLTINRVARAYSPWSSKIYGISNTLNK